MSRHRKEHRARRRVLALTALVLLGAAVIWHHRHEDLPASEITPPEWVEQALLPLNPWSRPGTPLREIDGIVVHYVGNPATSAEANRSYFANLALTHETYASAHFVVGLEGEVLQCVPLTEVAYCSSQANDHTVSIEVCHEDETGEFSAATMAALQTLTVWLCEELDLETSAVIRHYDVTGKVCPKFYVEQPEAWEAFLADLASLRAADPAPES